jgi:D-alanyl-D-alanine carboxypeptidase
MATLVDKAVKPTFAILVALIGIAGAYSAGVASVIVGQSLVPTNIKTVSVPTNTILAKAAIIFDPATGEVLYQKNANEALPLASLTKLMTAQTVLSVKSPSDVVQITPQDLEPEGDWGLKVGEALRLDDLIKLGLIASSNDAMAAVASSLGPDYIVRMNATAKKLGLTKTYFINPTGLDVSTEVAGSYGSAFDVARLAAAFYANYPDVFKETTEAKASVAVGDRTLVAAATAAPLFDIPGFIGAKTGYTDLAGGNLVTVFDLNIGHPVVAVVLGSTHEGRFTDMRTLITAARNSQ